MYAITPTVEKYPSNIRFIKKNLTVFLDIPLLFHMNVVIKNVSESTLSSLNYVGIPFLVTGI